MARKQLGAAPSNPADAPRLGDVVRYNEVVPVPSARTPYVRETQSDGTSSSLWPNNEEKYYKPFGEARKLVQWDNEYNELRLIPALNNTVALRIFQAVDATAYAARSSSIPAFEITDQRDGTRTTELGVYKGGRIEQNGNVTGTNFAFESTDTVDAAACIAKKIPAGTMIWKKTP